MRLMAGTKMVERTCIVTRTVCPPEKLIRFVAGPDGVVVPDIKNKLPGRGVWVTATREMVDQAAKNKLFARGLKTQAKADDDLGQMVDDLLTQAALGALGFAKKAGETLTGAGKVDEAVRSGKTIAILHASDGAEDGLRKLSQAAHAVGAIRKRKVSVWRIFSSDEMNMALGATNVIHAALMKGGASENCLLRVAQLNEFRGMEPS